MTENLMDGRKLPDWTYSRGGEPLLALAIHDGHYLRPEVARASGLDDATRLREEDPYTGELARMMPSWLVPVRSRFEVDLNRSPDGPVYLGPEQAWGLPVWKVPPTTSLLAGSKAYYSGFYEMYRGELERLLNCHDRVIVLDFHSYNHRRRGPGQPFDSPELNPDVNLGTGTLDRKRFGCVAEAFIRGMRGVTLSGRSLDVRENVKFRGGYLSGWTHERFPGRVCVLAIEFKKIFMDEWSGRLDTRVWAELKCGVGALIPALQEALRQTT